MIQINNQPMFDILTICEEAINGINASEILTLDIPNPDLGISFFAGTPLANNDIHHSWRAWNDLATLLFCRMLTPQLVSTNRVVIRLQKLNTTNSFHNIDIKSKEEKYGRESLFSMIYKNEEPAFIFAYRHALRAVNISSRRVVLDLGINGGDEFEVIEQMVDSSIYKEMTLIGIDHSATAIEYAKERFPNATLYCHDINNLETLNLPKSDLIISIGTLQSPNIAFKTLFMSLIQNYLSFDGAIILGFPNSRWIDAEMIYGASAPNYPFSEMSLVIKDIYFCKKYLQQHKFRVTITGKEYLFLTATKIGYYHL